MTLPHTNKFYDNIILYLQRLFPTIHQMDNNTSSSMDMTEEMRQQYIQLLKKQGGCFQNQYLLFLLETDFSKRTINKKLKNILNKNI